MPGQVSVKLKMESSVLMRLNQNSLDLRNVIKKNWSVVHRKKMQRLPRREAVLMNAGAAFYVAGKADTLEDAVKLAAEIIDSGKAKARLDEFIKLSNQE